MAKKKVSYYTDYNYYVVFLGQTALGVRSTWPDARDLRDQHPEGATKCNGYMTLAEALKAVERGPGYLGDVPPALFEFGE